MRLIEMKCKKCKKIYLLNIDDLQEYCPYCGKKLNLDKEEMNNISYRITQENPEIPDGKIIYKVIKEKEHHNPYEDKIEAIGELFWTIIIILFALCLFGIPTYIFIKYIL